MVPFVANMEYMARRYGHEEHVRRVFSFTLGELPFEEKILLPLSVICFLIAFAAAFRGFFLFYEVSTQRREDLGE
jgi:hypothetical protein